MVTKELKLKYGVGILNTIFTELNIIVNFKDMDTARRIFDDLYKEGCDDLQLNYYNKSPNIYVNKDCMINFLSKPDKCQ